MMRSCPHRCFVAEVPEMQQNTLTYPTDYPLRFMGMAIAYDKDSQTLSVDDGTAVAYVVVSELERLRIKLQQEGASKTLQEAAPRNTPILGQTLDCVVRITAERTLFATQILIVTDRDAETLRWFELLYQRSRDTELTEPWMGHPTRAELRPCDLYELIEGEANNNTLKPKKGTSLQTLAAVFGISMAKAEELVQQLQMTGHVYRNQDDLFQPL